MAPRFFLPIGLVSYTEIVLPEASAHHAARVLRLGVGDAVTLFDGTGVEFAGNIIFIGRQEVRVQLAAGQAVSRESPLQVTLIQGISSGDRMDYTLQKAVELGVARIVPVFCARSVVRLAGERAQKRQQHWQQLVVAACEQCGRNRVPEVVSAQSLESAISSFGEELGAGLSLLLDPLAEQGLRALAPPSQAVFLLAGPEGGMTDDERRRAMRAGFLGIRLGARVLRTETAALAAMAAMQLAWGDF